MLKLHIPPQNAPEDLIEWILPSDPAWDVARTTSDHDLLEKFALESLPKGASDEAIEAAVDKARSTHPITRWYLGETRFSHLAVMTVPAVLRTEDHPDSTVTIGEYLTGTPTIFVITSIGARNYRTALSAGNEHWHLELVRFGLVKITGLEKDGDVVNPARRPDGSISEVWLDGLDRQDRTLLRDLGGAIFKVCAKAGGEEKL